MPKKSLPPLQKKRRYAKYAMAGAMGVLVYTGMQRGRTSRSLHIAAGTALVGLSVYHTLLYKNRS
ncbi:conserved hypothetical protein [Denitrovibrio acetiphilus DSM 12809]|uniref:Transmembrane protein n=1 Tax=Denitrovibrio acetiphilus (strain DSM 12809 / NBRC 114555 / N2460) TaxID=522772 RepID=D4H2A3_DENA2|nr:hypothetical protein [Denitrovibrio acetiphilus]ADD68894.1 conserved hypothetical protein [Denitrovibrio acetiphilus DSM 12809]